MNVEKNEELENMLAEIKGTVLTMQANRKYNIELLTYTAGCVFAGLITLGCPIGNDVAKFKRKVDDWADEQPVLKDDDEV
jgi:hypothetical protein